MSDPRQPDELWLLWDDAGEDSGWITSGHYVAFVNEQSAARRATELNHSNSLNCTPVRVLPPPDTLAALLADERWKDNWTLEVSKFDGELICRVYKHSRGEMFEGVVCHPTPEAAVRAALETKGGA